ncbi:sensor histidine kinase [Streptomyces sp. NPDC056503]|uniref:sensor histidine kinase n=1 Tax=Streptomyces sp. NPDC056503 TaxID=3345842 RepID=UPI0036C2A1CC
MSLGSGLQRAQRFMILATGLYRASHLAAGVVAVAQHQRHRPLAWLALATALTGSVAVFGVARRRGWFAAGPAVADVVVVGGALPFVVGLGGASTAEVAWAMMLGGSASAVAAVTFPRRTVVAGVVVGLCLVHAVGYRLTGAEAGVIAGNLNSIVSSAVLAAVFWWYLRRQGSLLDEATAQALAAEARQAQLAERVAHHRALHDTVLATLTAIASGRADPGAEPVRERCAREAAYLRRLVQQQADGAPVPGTAVALEASVRSAESLGLRISAQYHAVPELPARAASALADATTEALNNVLRHSGTSHAYVTVTGRAEGEGHALLVTVVDRGAGFDPEAAAEGFGLRCSVRGRMREAGGAADVDSAPGEGTRVELRWPG